MRIKESDELGALLHEAGRQWACELHPRVATCIFEHLELGWSADMFERKLEFALDLEEVFDENERHAYKAVVGHIYAARAAAKRAALAQPFAPRDTTD